MPRLLPRSQRRIDYHAEYERERRAYFASDSLSVSIMGLRRIMRSYLRGPRSRPRTRMARITLRLDIPDARAEHAEYMAWMAEQYANGTFHPRNCGCEDCLNARAEA